MTYISAPSFGNKNRKLNRFTSLKELFSVLESKSLLLLDPAKWEDKNDALVLGLYRQRRGTNLLAKCFCEAAETIYFWKAYAKGREGCCIEFDRDILDASITKVSGVRMRSVEYCEIGDIRNSQIEVEDWPFRKRLPYRDEYEVRLIWEGNSNNASRNLEIDLDAIKKITLTQRMSKERFQATVSAIRMAVPNAQFEINQSTVYKNNEWIGAFQQMKKSVVPGPRV